MSKCDVCKTQFECRDGYHELLYIGCQENDYCCFEPMTNGDRIRNMSDWELAEWIAEVLDCHGWLYRQTNRFECEPVCPLYKCCNDQSADNIEEWLKQEMTDVPR